MLKELENETKKKNMEAVPRSRARSASATRQKPRQFIPNEVHVTQFNIVLNYLYLYLNINEYYKLYSYNKINSTSFKFHKCKLFY